MEIISNIALITINETLVIQIISFLIFLFIITRVMIRPLNSVMEERDTYMEGIRQDISAGRDKITELTTRLDERESAVRKESFVLKKQLEEAGSKEAVEINAAASKEISGLKKQAQAEIDTQIAEAQKYVREESEALATTIIEKILDRRLA